MTTATSPLSLKDLSIDAVDALSAARGEPAWLLDIRRAAFANFTAQPWPSAKDERWKRSDPAGFDWSRIALGAPQLSALSDAARFGGLGATVATNDVSPARRFIEPGAGQFTDVPQNFRDGKVEWMSLEDAVRLHADRIRIAWAAAVERAKADKFRSLTLALANAGSCLIVPKGQALKAPVHAYIAGGEGQSSVFPLTFYFLEESTEIQVWEELIGRQGDTLSPLFISSCAVVDMKDNAKGSFYFLQRWDEETTHFQFQDVSQAASSRFNAIAISIGGKMFRNETNVKLTGQGAENKVLGVLFGSGKQAFENWISQYHEAPKTTSDIQYRGALKGSSHSFFSGLVDIRRHAQQSDAFQSAKTLLLSSDAKADAIPNLEILADDVKCSHGAAVGPVDEDQKYYLQTRGVDPETAENIIVQGFFEPVIAEVPSETVQERLRSFVDEKLKK